MSENIKVLIINFKYLWISWNCLFIQDLNSRIDYIYKHCKNQQTGNSCVNHFWCTRGLSYPTMLLLLPHPYYFNNFTLFIEKDTEITVCIQSLKLNVEITTKSKQIQKQHNTVLLSFISQQQYNILEENWTSN